MARSTASTTCFFVALAASVFMIGGCSGGGGDDGWFGSSSSTSPTAVRSSTEASNPNEPMTMFEKRRLIARLQQDPRAVQRLTPRERREIAAMAAAAENKKDEDERD